MNATDQVDIKISPELIAPIIQAKVQAAIVESLGQQSDMIESVVAAALSTKVDDKGKPTDNSYYKMTFVEFMCRKAIHDATKQAFDEWITENKPKLVEQVKKQITKKPATFAKAFVDGIAGSLKTQWAFEVKIYTDN